MNKDFSFKAVSYIKGWRDPVDKRQHTYQQNVRKHKILLNKISYSDDPEAEIKRYKYQNLLPYIYFFKVMARKPSADQILPNSAKLILNIPDTIVYNDGDLPVMWLFTNQQGVVTRVDNVNSRQICAKLTERSQQAELVAVFKKPYYSGYGLQGNDTKLLSAKQLRQTILSYGSNRGEINVLQKYVKSNSVKPFIVRTCWKKNKTPECWIITSNYQYTSEVQVPEHQKFMTVPKVRGACSIFKTSSGKFLQETLVYIKNIVKYLQVNLQIELDEFVGDFTKDEGQNWWYINTKAFILSKQYKINLKQIINFGEYQQMILRKSSSKKKIQNYQKCKNCKYCNKIYPEHLMTHKLTLIMLLQADKHLLARGKDYPWLERCYTLHIGNVNLYIQYKVCNSCYKLYKQIEKLMQLQIQFAKLIGINVSEDNKNNVSITALPAFKGQSPQFGSRLQKNNYEQKMPQNWGFPTGENIQIQNLNKLGEQSIVKYRLLFLIQSLRDIPKESLNKNYYLEYYLFETKIKYKIDFQKVELLENGYYKVDLDKIRIFYFFAVDRKSLNQFLKEQETFKLSLLEQDRKIGELQLELSDFLSEKVIKREYYKMFSGKEIFPILSWGLHVTLGIHESQQIQLSNLKLHQYKRLYLHDNQDYYNCDPLPEEWVNLIMEKDDVETKLKTQTNGFDIFAQTPEKQGDRKIQIGHKQALNELDREIIRYSRRRVQSQRTKRRIYY